MIDRLQGRALLAGRRRRRAARGRLEVHRHLGAPARQVAELDRLAERLDHRQADPAGELLGGRHARPDPDAVIADERVEPVRDHRQLDLQRALALAALVGVQHDVVAGLRDGGRDVVQRDGVEPDGLGQAAERLAHEQDVLGPVREPQPDVRRSGHEREGRISHSALIGSRPAPGSARRRICSLQASAPVQARP